MALVPDTPAAGADARATLDTRGLKPTDINPDEMDKVTMRIFHELRKQLSMMESKKADQLDAGAREPRPHSRLSRTHHGTPRESRGRTRCRAQKHCELSGWNSP